MGGPPGLRPRRAAARCGLRGGPVECARRIAGLSRVRRRPISDDDPGSPGEGAQFRSGARPDPVSGGRHGTPALSRCAVRRHHLSERAGLRAGAGDRAAGVAAVAEARRADAGGDAGRLLAHKIRALAALSPREHRTRHREPDLAVGNGSTIAGVGLGNHPPAARFRAVGGRATEPLRRSLEPAGQRPDPATDRGL